ncbi:ClpA/ClpB-like protein [Glaciihabitans tibetensis]|uniref:ClpA/ClpB-like protein n=1 Tax=Glaciihabitans tibetensis TaxID=1266600 RepID=A0A2T0V5L5_9MICO|nr:Clp protease N-terminal domain-containing protein [Glaciihabitans tibetensis]PRY65444.1 ClpA/ClpB-like protein [Glaciihabitans tibetensis]
MAIRNALADIRTMNALFTAAENAATELGDEQPGAEHLLLAALDLDDASARAAFDAVNVTPDEVRSALVQVHAAALRAVGIEAATVDQLGSPGSSRPLTGPYRSTGSAQDLFQGARRLSASDKPSLLRAGHIVIVAAEAEYGTVARLIDLLEIDRAHLTEAARAAIAS